MREITLKIKRDGKLESTRKVQLKDINLDERCELMDLMLITNKDNSKFFTNIVNCIRVATNMTDDEINEFNNEELIELFKVIGDALNQKK